VSNQGIIFGSRNEQSIAGVIAASSPQIAYAQDFLTAKECSLPFIEAERAWTARYVRIRWQRWRRFPMMRKCGIYRFILKKQVCILRLKDTYAKKYDYAD